MTILYIYRREGVCCVVAAAALWAGIYTLTTGAVGDRRHVFFCSNPPRIYILYNHIDCAGHMAGPSKTNNDHKRRSDLQVIVCLYEYIYILTGQSQLVGACLLCVL